MRVKFYGVRGSLPSCGKDFQRFGGNTTCLRITRENDQRIAILDAGTGIRNLGKYLMSKQVKYDSINIYFTHFHWDHIQGFPFFAPAYDRNQKIKIQVLGKEREYKNIRDVFSRQMEEDYFPVGLDAMGAHFEFASYGDRHEFYGAKVIAAAQHHKFLGGSYGFRIEDKSGTLVICTDVEHVNGIDENIVMLAKDADLLVHDGQYTDEEYRKFKGWGHSSWRHAVEVAIRANAKRLIITHHDPDHNDDFLDAMENECMELFPNSQFAREGLEVDV